MTNSDPSIVPTGVPTGHIDFNPAGNMFAPQQHAASGEDGPALSLSAPPVRHEPAPVAQRAPAPPPMASADKPLDVIRAAKSRARYLRVQLRAAKKWERELAKLERLLAAADGKPVALVRNIDSSRRVS